MKDTKENLIKICPECGKKMLRQSIGIVLTSYPPQYPMEWLCGCGHRESAGIDRGLTNEEIQLEQGKMKDVTLKQVISDMIKDKEPGSTYYSWLSNLTMAIYDEMGGAVTKEKAGKCAKRFLDILLLDPTSKEK